MRLASWRNYDTSDRLIYGIFFKFIILAFDLYRSLLGHYGPAGYLSGIKWVNRFPDDASDAECLGPELFMRLLAAPYASPMNNSPSEAVVRSIFSPPNHTSPPVQPLPTSHHSSPAPSLVCYSISIKVCRSSDEAWFNSVETRNTSRLPVRRPPTHPHTANMSGPGKDTWHPPSHASQPAQQQPADQSQPPPPPPQQQTNPQGPPPPSLPSHRAAYQ